MDTSNRSQKSAYWVPKLGEEISEEDKKRDITFMGWEEGDLRKAKICKIIGILYTQPDIRRAAGPICDTIIRITSVVPHYRGGRLVIAEINYDGTSMRSNCFSGDVQFMEGGKEALEQLDEEVKELDNANWTAAPPFLVRLAYFAAPMLAIALVLPYRE